MGTSWKSCLCLVALVLAFAPNAQAIYVDIEDSAAAEGQNVEMGGVSMTITYESRAISLGDVHYTLVTKTISFDDGPVLLNSVEIDHDKGMTIATTSNGLVVTHGANAVNAMVSRITTTNMLGMGEVAKGVNINISTPTSAIPEPGAALLFSAGLAVVGVTVRRQR